ncbi:hypothetical protein GCM10010967_51300 [Dyadobacter beijingensis]|uniref:Adhesin domain-containing protein n=1 Tax=Dyadobacter beijingensis TaxID=365489 RepID=A0ABQ2IHS2_9BACT|nr:hypothetical protein [Dyadobacter beijingensis]GGN09188.1 hypothetical protein GCM10010967_51300 [Dyadobacter beijingensis]
MTTIKKIATLLLFSVIALPQVASAALNPDESEQNGLVEKRRNIVKIFDVKKSDALEVDNQFGLVKVNLWAKEEIKIEIVVTANAPSDSRAAEYLSSVNIDEKRVKNVISLTTRIDRNQFGNNGWNKSKGDKNFIQIDYTVYMPKENSLTVRNKFGNTDIPSFYAPLTVDSKHGNFVATLLENPDNVIDVQFGSARIGKMDGGKLDCQYANVKLDQAKKVWLSNKFGELMIGDVVNLDAAIDYSGAKIGKISGTGKIKLNYSGNFKIEELTHSAQNVDIQASYSSVVLPAEANQFNVSVTYGKFSYPTENVNFSMQPDKDGRPDKMKHYQGKIGSGGGTKITVTSVFGDVRLKE